MLKGFFSPVEFKKDTGIAIVRIIIGTFMIYHGIEIFDKEKMSGYEKWFIDMKLAQPFFIAYFGKAVELISGILIFLGFLTRIGAIILAMSMLFITFQIGQGRIFMEEQHPFLFFLFGLLFFFTGAGKWSLDRIIFKKYRGTLQRA